LGDKLDGALAGEEVGAPEVSTALTGLEVAAFCNGFGDGFAPASDAETRFDALLVARRRPDF
jgi:hypothetical protein